MRYQETTGIGIVNPDGDLWTDKVFKTPEAAIRYLREFWGTVPNNTYDEELWALTPVLKRVTPLDPTDKWKLADYAPGTLTAQADCHEHLSPQHRQEGTLYRLRSEGQDMTMPRSSNEPRGKSNGTSLELHGSGGFLIVTPGCSTGPANDGLMLDIHSSIPSSHLAHQGVHWSGGILTRDDARKLRDIIDEHLSKPERTHYMKRIREGG